MRRGVFWWLEVVVVVVGVVVVDPSRFKKKTTKFLKENMFLKCLRTCLPYSEKTTMYRV